jgi:hypothetical protein
LGIETIIHWRIDGKRRAVWPKITKDRQRSRLNYVKRIEITSNRHAQITMQKPKMPKPKREREREFKMENNGPVRNFYASENQIKIT